MKIIVLVLACFTVSMFGAEQTRREALLKMGETERLALVKAGDKTLSKMKGKYYPTWNGKIGVVRNPIRVVRNADGGLVVTIDNNPDVQKNGRVFRGSHPEFFLVWPNSVVDGRTVKCESVLVEDGTEMVGGETIPKLRVVTDEELDAVKK